jgi:DNA-binding NarL/FixJ family response regulator
MEIFIVDDHQIVRDGISALLTKTGNIHIAGEAANAEEAMLMLKKKQPDVLITDIAMPGISGIELTKLVKEKYPQIEVIIFSSHSEGENVVNALDAGAKGILPKTTIREELIEALLAVSNGKEFISKYIPASTFIHHFKKNKENEKIKETLSDREIEILKLIVNGKNNKEISEQLFISQRTVEKHKSNILVKMEMKSVVDMVKYAIKHKLVDMD